MSCNNKHVWESSSSNVFKQNFETKVKKSKNTTEHNPPKKHPKPPRNRNNKQQHKMHYQANSIFLPASIYS